jgi:transcriptional regulator with XRE-family HTH domain
MLTIGEKIKKFREQRGISQKDFAYRIGMKPPYLSEIEGGKKEITSKIIINLKKEFNISSDWLLFSNKEFYSQKDILKNTNSEEIDSLNNDVFLLNRHKELLDLRDQLLVICMVLKNNASYVFTNNEVEEINKISKGINLIMKIIFDKKELESKDRLIINSVLNTSKELLEKYITELEYKLHGHIASADELLPDLT